MLKQILIETCILTLNSLIKYMRLPTALCRNELKMILQCLVDIQNNRAPKGWIKKLKLNWSLCSLVQSHRSICQGGLNVIAIFSMSHIIEFLTRAKVTEIFCFSSNVGLTKWSYMIIQNRICYKTFYWERYAKYLVVMVNIALMRAWLTYFTIVSFHGFGELQSLSERRNRLHFLVRRLNSLGKFSLEFFMYEI